MKICFAASSGGHFEQMMRLEALMSRNESFILTEKTQYSLNCRNHNVYYLDQINRRERGWKYKFLKVAYQSLKIYLKEKPDVVICTGVLAMIPMCLLCKLGRKKLIYIESFAKSNSPSETGKFLYRFADLFYVQWFSMLKYFPGAICLGGIY